MKRIGRYVPPFNVQDGVIYDQEGQKVKLWGVNYYAPFNHNYYNISELGKDHFSAIDEDIRHLKMLGVDMIRMHLYEREITDRWGHIVENHNMKVFDYLVEQCAEHEIYLMLSPTVWWNTIKNQIVQEQLYAYWHIDAQDAFGFTNYYSCDSLLWDPEVIECQQTYLDELCSRASTYSGKRLSEYPNIVVLELINEPRYPEKTFLDEEPVLNSQNLHDSMICRGRQRQKFRRMWQDFCASHSGETDEDRCFSFFRAQIMRNYFDRMLPILDRHFGRRVLRAQFTSYSGLPPEDLQDVFKAANFDAYTIGTYLNVNLFDSNNTDDANHLTLATQWFDRLAAADFGTLAKISYEFDATATQNGYPLAAIAAEYARHNVQIAAYFTYTPASVAAWNPGWLVHFMNIAHTPSRAAGFAAAGDIFREHSPDDEIRKEDGAWSGRGYAIERKDDFVYALGAKAFRYSNSNDIALAEPKALELVSGRGNSRFAESSGNGFYIIEKCGDKRYCLTVFPNHRYIGAPERGKAYRCMANRYVNCCKEPPVSQLSEDTIYFRLNLFRVIAVRSSDGHGMIPVEANGRFCIRPGVYQIEVE